MHLDEDEEIEAFGYIGNENDEKNKGFLTDKHFIILRKGRPYHFPVKNITDISFNERKLLLPTVLGGIISPFCLLLIFKEHIHSWPVLSLFFLGVFLFYIGVSGTLSLTVQTSLKEYDIFISQITPNFRAFVLFSKNRIRGFHQHHKNPNLIKIVLTQESWERSDQGKLLSAVELQDEDYLEGFLPEMETILQQKISSSQAPLVILTLNPLKVKASIRYQISEKYIGYVTPRIFGKINADAIEKIETISNS